MSGDCYDVDGEVVLDARRIEERGVDELLEDALAAAEDPSVREHVRRAMQARIMAAADGVETDGGEP